MTKNLTDFLMENPVDGVFEEIVISKRLKDFTFKIKAMSGEEFTKYQKEATKIHKKKKVEFDSTKFSELVILNHTIEPNFKNSEMLEKAGCKNSPEAFLYKFLLAGEIAELTEQISALSGFDKDIEDLVDEAKNS